MHCSFLVPLGDEKIMKSKCAILLGVKFSYYVTIQRAILFEEEAFRLLAQFRKLVQLFNCAL